MSSEKHKDLKCYEANLNIEDEKHSIKENELYGSVVVFDLTSSTMLKQDRGFPGWISDLKKFQRVIFNTFTPEISKWSKFLGDAYMFFFPDERDDNSILATIEADELIKKCKKVMDDYWNFYKIYSSRERGGKKSIDFREMTCAIDYGGEVIDWFKQTDDSKSKFDPIGKPIDRCFRISSIAGPGQTLISRSFYEKNETELSSTENTFIKINLAKNTLKGFPEENFVYYLKPSKKQSEYILDDTNVELVEDSKDMITKAKLKLLREEKNSEN